MTLKQILDSMPSGHLTVQISFSLSNAILVARACLYHGYLAAIVDHECVVNSNVKQGDFLTLIKKRSTVH